MIFKNPKKEYHGKIEDYPLENYPDYEPGKAPKTEVLQEISYLDELEESGVRTGGARESVN